MVFVGVANVQAWVHVTETIKVPLVIVLALGVYVGSVGSIVIYFACTALTISVFAEVEGTIMAFRKVVDDRAT